MNKFKVTICNKEFCLQTDEPPEYYINLAKKVEREIYSLSNGADNLSVFRGALLAALSASDEASKSNESIDNIRVQLKEYIDDACYAKMERDEALKNYETEKAKSAKLENEIKLLKLKGNVDDQLSFDGKKK